MSDHAPAKARRRLWPWVLAALGAAVLLVSAGLAARALMIAQGEMLAARASVVAGQDALREFDVTQAHGFFVAAKTDFQDGVDLLSLPLLRATRAVPVAGPNVEAASMLADAGVLVATAAVDVTGVIAEMPDGIGSLAPRGGAVPVAALQTLAAPAVTAAERLATAERMVRQSPDEGLVEQVAAARAEFLAQITEARKIVDVAAQLGEAMPKLLGAQQARTYLFVAQNPAELRGTGGFMGAFATVTFDRGRLSFSDFDTIHDLQSYPVSEVEAPNPDYAARYNRYGGAGFWPSLNATPDFPSAAKAMENLWQRARGDDLDGVIAADPFALAELLRIAGPVNIPGFGTVGPDEVVEVVANEAYDEFDSGQDRKRLLGAIAARALGGALSGGVEDPLAAAHAIIDAAEDGHLLVHAVDPDVQAALDLLGVTGRLLDPAGDYLSVIVNNAGANKVDYYVDRTVTYTVQLREDGSAEGKFRVVFDNEAPTEGLPDAVLGPNVDDIEAGTSRSVISIFCARRCDVTDADPPVGDGGFRKERELGHTVFSTTLDVKSGASEDLQMTWELPGIWKPDPDGGVYRLTLQPQPAIRPARQIVVVEAPDGMEITSVSDGMDIKGGQATFDDRVRGDLVLDVTVRPRTPAQS